jgi:AmmeMemoRadiSam system protein B
MSTVVRQAAVAGYFYPGRAEKLLEDIRAYTAAPTEKIHTVGCVIPHAGYMYSGHVAGAVYARMELPRRFIILGPNHTGRGRPLAIMSQGAWQTPLGNAEIDATLAGALKRAFPYLEEDDLAHRTEHAIEVQLPFLQAAREEFTFIPIAIGTSQYAVLAALGEAIADVVNGAGEEVLLVASSDMNHYEADDVTRVKDRKAIDKILAMDARGLYDTVVQEEISMCGFGPTVAMLTASRSLAASSAELVRYATSAEVSGDYSTVVGYAGAVVRK